MARAILAHETERLGRSLVLLAGSWARKPAIVDPGYWAPRTFELLAAATHDQRFARLKQSTISLARDLTANPPHLPPDWATVSATGVPQPIAGPPGSRPRGDSTVLARRRSPADPLRRGMRREEQPDTRGHVALLQYPAAEHDRLCLQPRWPPARSPADRHGARGRRGGGAVRTPDRRAATAAAQADAINTRFPTYFGSAWVALGRVELETALLGSCS